MFRKSVTRSDIPQREVIFYGNRQSVSQSQEGVRTSILLTQKQLSDWLTDKLLWANLKTQQLYQESIDVSIHHVSYVHVRYVIWRVSFGNETFYSLIAKPEQLILDNALRFNPDSNVLEETWSSTNGD